MKKHLGYTVSDCGTIIISPSGRHLSIRDQKVNGKISGYKYASLLLDGKVKGVAVHRLVAMLYVENPHSKPWVNHKDGDKGNNSFGNLEWTTISENIKHSYDSLGRKKSSPMEGKKHCDKTLKKLSEAKIGRNHPKFSGLYCWENSFKKEVFRGETPLDLKEKSGLKCHVMSIFRRCKKQKNVNFWFEPLVDGRIVSGNPNLKNQ